MGYKGKVDQERLKALEELAAEARRLTRCKRVQPRQAFHTPMIIAPHAPMNTPGTTPWKQPHSASLNADATEKEWPGKKAARSTSPHIPRDAAAAIPAKRLASRKYHGFFGHLAEHNQRIAPPTWPENVRAYMTKNPTMP
jgi:hypothetical protein